jgi:hypothetical protein
MFLHGNNFPHISFRRSWSAPSLLPGYRKQYINMGHNDIDYENRTHKELSFRFANETQNRLIIDALLWLGKKK